MTSSETASRPSASASKWAILAVLGAAQFLMVLDQAVMNVAISQLVADFDTTVTTIQAVIALYALVMAGLMLTGGKLGDLIGRRRVFAIGLVIYGAGSALTAVAWSVPVLTLGWSVLEGIGAALVLPAMVALVAGNFRGQDRALAYGVLGGVAGAGIAVGPIVGGWATTELSWRVVFAGEVVIAIGILLGTRLLVEPPRSDRRASLDWVGGVLSAAGLGLFVFGVIQASNWGWIWPRSSPVEPFGFALTPFVIAAGLLVLAGFVRWQRRRESRGEQPLLRTATLPPAAAAQRRGDAAGPEPDPDGDLLHGAAVPADRAGPRRARDGCSDAPRLGRAVRRRARRIGAGQAVPGTATRPGRSGDRVRAVAAAARHDRARSRQHLLPRRDGRSGGRHGAGRLPARATSSSPRSGTTTAARRAGCSTPPSSSAPRSAPPSSARSSSPACWRPSPAASSTTRRSRAR